MYHLSRFDNDFQRPLGSAANEETAKNLIEKYEANPPEWVKQSNGTWKAVLSNYIYYIVGEDYTDYGRTFASRV